MTSGRLVWVLLSYRVPRVPSTPRIAVWRSLRRLGVAQLGDGVVALPYDARTQEQLDWVANDVEAAGGWAMLWRAEALDQRDEHRLSAELAAARAAEYRDIFERAHCGDDVGVEERARLLGQLRRELRRIQRRDYFPPAEAELARRAVEELSPTAPRTVTASRAVGAKPGASA